MTKESYKKEMHYALALVFIRGLKEKELLTKEEFRRVQIKLKQKYRPIYTKKIANIG